jgi:hypothetical protein
LSTPTSSNSKAKNRTRKGLVIVSDMNAYDRRGGRSINAELIPAKVNHEF